MPTLTQLISMLIVTATWDLFHRLVNEEMALYGVVDCNGPYLEIIDKVLNQEAKEFGQIYPPCFQQYAIDNHHHC